jgi:hypothetical protein
MKKLTIQCELIREIEEDETSKDAENYVMTQLEDFGIGIHVNNMYVSETVDN